jgi:hypothetical protein
MPQIYNTHFAVTAFAGIDKVKDKFEEALRSLPWAVGAWCAPKQKYVIHAIDDSGNDVCFKVHILPFPPNNWWLNFVSTRRNPHVAMYTRVFYNMYNAIARFFEPNVLPDTHPYYVPRYSNESHMLPSFVPTHDPRHLDKEEHQLSARDIVHDFYPMLFASLRTYALLQLSLAPITLEVARDTALLRVTRACVWTGLPTPVSWVHLFALWKLARYDLAENQARAYDDLVAASSVVCASCTAQGYRPLLTPLNNSKQALHMCIACFSVSHS